MAQYHYLKLFQFVVLLIIVDSDVRVKYVIMFTSCKEEEGKSSSACNQSLSLNITVYNHT